MIEESKLCKNKPVQPASRISFHCTQCGNCCRHVKYSVPLETLDLFRLTQFLIRQGNELYGMEAVLLQYTSPQYLTENGYPIFFLNSTGPEDECIFFKDGLCSIQQAKPRACRLYPFYANPGEKRGEFDYFLCLDQPHHFSGEKLRTGDWMWKYFAREDRDFIQLNYKSALEIEQRLSKLRKPIQKDRALSLILFYKYISFDLDTAFLPQFRENIRLLLQNLDQMVKESSC